MAKPHLDFPTRESIDGTEELYSQSINWEPAEQKFTVAQLASFILAQIPESGETNTASNVGETGIEIFDKKVGADLQFRKLRSLSEALSINQNGQLIEFGLDEATLNPPMNLADLNDITSPSGANTMLFWDGENFDWTDRGVSISKNVGTEGIGVFDSKTDFEFGFRNITPKSPKVQITLSGKNIEVDVDSEQLAGDINLEDLSNLTSPTNSDVILHWNGTAYDWIPTPSGGGGNASNGLSSDTDIQLGGTLTKNTTIDTDVFEFDIKHKTVGVKSFLTNPFWANGDESFFIHAKNDSRDTENIVGVTNQGGDGGIAKIWSRKPTEGSYAYLWQIPGNTNFRSFQTVSQNRAEVNFGYNTVALEHFANGNPRDKGALSMTTGLSQFMRQKNTTIVNLKIQAQSTSNQILEVLFEGLPQYADVATAQAQGYPSKGLFKTTTGALFIVP